MKTFHRLTGRWLALASGVAASLGALNSCKLPSDETMTRIQRDTLVGHLADRHEKDMPLDLPESVIPEVANYPVLDGDPGAGSGVVGEVVTGPVEVPTVVTSTFGTLEAAAVPEKPGYVYTPHVAGEWMVDVREFEVGEKVLCPYTRKVFMVPAPDAGGTSDPQGAPSPAVVVQNKADTPPVSSQSDPKPRKKPADPALTAGPSTKPLTPLKKDLPGSKPKMADSGKKRIEGDSANKESATGKLAAAPKTQKKKEAPELKKKEEPAPKKTEKPAPKPSVDDTLPYGTPISGKPNFVYSPFASRNQIVDVSGLDPGTKVRCPYSGKLFRVPSPTQSKEETGEKSKEAKTPPEPRKKASSEPVPGDSGSKQGASGGTPTAARVQNKPGYVQSPYGKYVIDVRGKKPGSVVLCPFTGKPFRVPGP